MREDVQQMFESTQKQVLAKERSRPGSVVGNALAHMPEDWRVLQGVWVCDGDFIKFVLNALKEWQPSTEDGASDREINSQQAPVDVQTLAGTHSTIATVRLKGGKYLRGYTAVLDFHMMPVSRILHSLFICLDRHYRNVKCSCAGHCCARQHQGQHGHRACCKYPVHPQPHLPHRDHAWILGGPRVPQVRAHHSRRQDNLLLGAHLVNASSLLRSRWVAL